MREMWRQREGQRAEKTEGRLTEIGSSLPKGMVCEYGDITF